MDNGKEMGMRRDRGSEAARKPGTGKRKGKFLKDNK